MKQLRLITHLSVVLLAIMVITSFLPISTSAQTPCCSYGIVRQDRCPGFSCFAQTTNSCIPQNWQCTASETCVNDYCVDPNSITPTVIPGTCNNIDEACCPTRSGPYCTNGLQCIGGVCKPPAPTTPTTDTVPAFRMCEQLTGEAFTKCADCVGNPDNPDHVWTALGCIPTSPQGFAQSILTLGIGIAGGLALLLMIFGAGQVALSSGDPKASDAGKQTFTGAIVGLLFILFSVVILRFIGFDILQLPGF